MAEQVQSTPTILRRKQVESCVGLSRSTLYQLIATGGFPAPVPLGSRSVGWVEAEVAAWLRDRIAKRDRAAT
jgi:prophage regulatory protein